MASAGPAVEAILGFRPSDFLSDVSEAVDRQLVADVESFKRELQTMATSKGYKAVTSAKLEEHCQILLERLRRHFGRNMGKFELYATRNIFVMPEHGGSGSGSSSSSSSSSGGSSRGSSSSSGEDGSLEEITAEVDRLRAKYHELQAAHTTLATETRDGEVLLRDMRDAIYKVRVGSQVLDDHNVQPLSDTMSSLAGDRKTLEDLTRRADELADEIDKAVKAGSTPSPDEQTVRSSGSSSSAGAGAVRTAGAADISGLSASIRGGK